MIEVKKLNKSYDKKKVIKDLSLKLENNSIYGLVGANGAGKSTLLRIINGIFMPDSGEILVDGHSIFDNEILKQKIVFVPDDLFFYPNYTLLDMAKFYEAMYEKFDMSYFKRTALKLKLDLDAKINTFSKGMKRQCALICALSTNAKYMFFDETFDGVDPVVRILLKRLIAEKMEDNDTTIILTSHNLRELEDICDNIGLLYDGGILFESDIDSLKTKMFKVQISLKNDFSRDDFKDLDILSFKKCGSVAQIILRGDKDKITDYLKSLNPVILDFVSLSLEEIFIYEMEALGYEFGSIV